MGIARILARPRLVRDARLAPGSHSLRGGARAQGGDATRGMAGCCVRSGITKSFRVLATDAPPIRREAWATLQEWAVCSSIFVVGRGVKAGLPGSTPRGTLNARCKRVARSRRPGGRRTAYIAPRPAPPRWMCRSHSVVRPSPRSSNYGENGDGSTEPQAASWRPCASVDLPLVPRARCVACSSTYYKLQSEWHGAGSAAFVRGPLGPHFY